VERETTKPAPVDRGGRSRGWCGLGQAAEPPAVEEVDEEEAEDVAGAAAAGLASVDPAEAESLLAAGTVEEEPLRESVR
jgi:hypothetical protein